MLKSLPVLLALIVFQANVNVSKAHAEESITLLGTIVNWRYPDATIGKSEMSDAATVNVAGNRTVPSTLLKTTMTTPDSVDKVVAFYRELLKRKSSTDANFGLNASDGRSVILSDESADRPFKLHTILVHSANKSTTLVISRGNSENKTFITWKQYIRLGDVKR